MKTYLEKYYEEIGKRSYDMDFDKHIKAFLVMQEIQKAMTEGKYYIEIDCADVLEDLNSNDIGTIISIFICIGCVVRPIGKRIDMFKYEYTKLIIYFNKLNGFTTAPDEE